MWANNTTCLCWPIVLGRCGTGSVDLDETGVMPVRDRWILFLALGLRVGKCLKTQY
jgi:hypothetical protein